MLGGVLGVLAEEMVSQGLIKKSSKIGLRHNFVNLFFKTFRFFTRIDVAKINFRMIKIKSYSYEL
jgi:hypothetical protein